MSAVVVAPLQSLLDSSLAELFLRKRQGDAVGLLFFASFSSH